MTKLKYFDKRENANFTFGELNVGDSFTIVHGKEPFIKTAVMYDDHKDAYNTVGFDGEFYWSDDNEKVEPIREIEVIIKK